MCISSEGEIIQKQVGAYLWGVCVCVCVCVWMAGRQARERTNEHIHTDSQSRSCKKTIHIGARVYLSVTLPAPDGFCAGKEERERGEG